MTEQVVNDLALNEKFEVFVNARGDIAFVNGKEAFEQELLLRISSKYLDIVGENDRGTVTDLLELEAERTAKEMDALEKISDISVIFPDDAVNTVEVTIIYDTGEVLQFREEG